MWAEIIKRTEKLKQLDCNKVLLGANVHGYDAAPCLSMDEIREFELKIKTELPSQLKAYYLEVGNGGFGPDYGLSSIEKLILHKPNLEWLGCDFLNETTEDLEEVTTGMICIMDRYCNHEGCIVSKGPDTGLFIDFNPWEGWAWIGSNDLLSLFNTWLDKELDKFSFIKSSLIKHESIKNVIEDLNTKYNTDYQNGLTLIASMLDFPFKYHPDARAALNFKSVSLNECEITLKDETVVLFDEKIKKYLSVNNK